MAGANESRAAGGSHPGPCLLLNPQPSPYQARIAWAPLSPMPFRRHPLRPQQEDTAELQNDIAGNKVKAEEYSGKLKSEEAQLELDIVKRNSGKAALVRNPFKAEAGRTKEQSEFDADSTDSKANIAATANAPRHEDRLGAKQAPPKGSRYCQNNLHVASTSRQARVTCHAGRVRGDCVCRVGRDPAEETGADIADALLMRSRSPSGRLRRQRPRPHQHQWRSRHGLTTP